MFSRQPAEGRVRILTVQIGKIRDVSRAKSVGLDWKKNDEDGEDLEREIQVRGGWHSGLSMRRRFEADLYTTHDECGACAKPMPSPPSYLIKI